MIIDSLLALTVPAKLPWPDIQYGRVTSVRNVKLDSDQWPPMALDVLDDEDAMTRTPVNGHVRSAQRS